MKRTLAAPAASGHVLDRATGLQMTSAAVWGPEEGVDGAGLSLPAHADRLAALVLERGQLGGLQVLLDELRRCLIPAQRGLEQGDTRQVARGLQRLEAVTSALTRELSAHARIQP